MTRSFATALVVCAFAGALVSRAQDTDPAYVPLTLGEKYQFSLNKVIGTGALTTVALKASMDQMLDRPHAWGPGIDSYAVRTASYFGRSFVRQNLAFGVRALDGEDPRYFRSGRGTKWERSKYAIAHTFMVRNDSGGSMPAYSLMVSSFATPFLANQWRPDRCMAGREVGAGFGGLGIAAGSSILQEFLPDIRQKLRHHWIH